MGNENSQFKEGEENLELPHETCESKVSDQLESAYEWYKAKENGLKLSKNSFKPNSSRQLKGDTIDFSLTKPHLTLDLPASKRSEICNEIDTPRNIAAEEEDEQPTYTQIIVEEKETLITESCVLASSEYLQPEYKIDPTPEKKLYDHNISLANPLSEVNNDSIRNQQIEKSNYVLGSLTNGVANYQEKRVENLLSEETFHAENVMVFNNKLKSKDKSEAKAEKEVKIHRDLFATDLWFTGLGMNIFELCDPNQAIIKEGELYRYKPGLHKTYITRWCQLTTKVFRVYKNQMSAKGFGSKPIVAIPLYVIKNVRKCRFKIPNSSKKNYDSELLGQNQFELNYKDEIITEIMKEFLKSKSIPEEEYYGDITERKAEATSQVEERLNILKSNLQSNKPFMMDCKTQTLNTNSSWSSREGEWFLAEKRLLFSTKRTQDLAEWLQCLRKIFVQDKENN
ncbi:unnamed protein product [Moneuplotes crassus]|uniref:PH domain-containing protein n=1 Tax=Euplotes crassus TaxID=5936 RepID=A0AAD1UEB1_EUPCR|nr:unnamed protein product [Moneuplotes crassus]